MFVGSVPKECIEQAIRVVGVDNWGDVAVCCSGSFRVDKTLAIRGVRVHSNDVSLLSCALGAYLTGSDLDFEFEGALAPLSGLSRTAKGIERVALVGVALDMSGFTRDNLYAKKFFAHYAANADWYVARGTEKLAKHLEGLRIESYFAGDFREHARRAQERGYGVLGFPPTYKKGYERIFKVLNASTRWTEPSYDIWDPKDIAGWLAELRDSKARYCVFSDQIVEGFTPTSAYISGRNKPVYFYASTEKASIRRSGYRVEKFRYTPLDASRLTERSEVRIVEATSPMMNFLKDKYLSSSIHHTSGAMNFIVLIDGMLAGGFIYQRSQFGGKSIYLLSDFSVTRERRVAKLIALLATAKGTVREFEKRYLEKVLTIETTAFTDKPVSMKYRGVFDVASRKPGHIQYSSKVRDAGPDELYRTWFGNQARDAGRQSGPKDAQAS